MPLLTLSALRRNAALAAVGFALPTLAANAAPPSVLTQHNDNARTGANLNETTLTTANVKSALFGKLFTLTLDANVNGQVLYVPGLTINGATHNVVIAYTSNNNNGSVCSVYAYDADSPTQTTPLWKLPLPTSAQWTTATPVIDPNTNTLYVLTKSTNDAGSTYLRAINLLTGIEKTGSPMLVAASVPGTGDGSSNGVVSFDTSHANCRPGLLFVNNTIYIGIAHNSDSFPYHGWVFGYQYNGTAFTQTNVFCTNPYGGEDGIWQSGKGLAADSDGNIYAAVGNGTFDANTTGLTRQPSYGMCYLKLSPSLTVLDWFSPHDESGLSNSDLDLGGAGPLVIPGTTRLFGGGTKFASVFLLDTNNLGKHPAGNTDSVIQRIDNVGGSDYVGQNPICWDAGATKYVYVWPGRTNNNSDIYQFAYDSSTGKFTSAGAYKTTSGLTKGGSLGITANGSQNGILWSVGNDNVVRAYGATDISKPALWTSIQNSSRDALPSVGHFQFPTVVNGKAYIPSGSKSIVVYGLQPVALGGTVTLDGLAASAAPRTVTLTFRPNDGSASFARTAPIDSTGTLTLTGVTAGSYMVHLAAAGYLQKNVSLDATNGAVSNFSVTLPAGDATGDNTVNFDDFLVLLNAFGGDNSVAGSGYDASADFNGDGVINFDDFLLLLGNYDAQGDS